MSLTEVPQRRARVALGCLCVTLAMQRNQVAEMHKAELWG